MLANASCLARAASMRSAKEVELGRFLCLPDFAGGLKTPGGAARAATAGVVVSDCCSWAALRA
jgi:hypothetical protein